MIDVMRDRHLVRWLHHEATTYGVIFQPYYVNEQVKLGGGNYPPLASKNKGPWNRSLESSRTIVSSVEHADTLIKE